MEIKIDAIVKLTIKDQTFELTMDELRTLKTMINGIIPESTTTVPVITTWPNFPLNQQVYYTTGDPTPAFRVGGAYGGTSGAIGGVVSPTIGNTVVTC